MTDNHDARDGVKLTTADHLKRFYVELQAWIEGGCADNGTFTRSRGMCLAIEPWAMGQKLPVNALYTALKRQFAVAGLHPDFPFDGSHAAFIYSVNAQAHFANPSRLAWVKARASGEPIASAAQKEDSSHVG